MRFIDSRFDFLFTLFIVNTCLICRKDSATAVAILVKDLKVFSAFNDELFKEIALLLTLENFRENEQLSKYGDVKSARVIMLGELKKLIEANPALRDKLTFPNVRSSRLRTLINQSLNWQHQLCKNPKPHPDIKTLFVDHCCGPSHLSQPNSALAQSPVTSPLLGAVPRFPPTGVPGPFPPAPAPAPAPGPLPSNLTSWMANQVAAHPSASAGPIGLVLPNILANQAFVLSLPKRARTPPASGPAVEYQTGDPEHVLKRTKASGPSDEVCISLILLQVPVNVLPVGYSGQSSSSYSSEDLPKAVVMTLNQSSSVKSMDFHPLKQALLLVGTNAGEFSIWDLGTQDKLAHKNFKIWDLAARSASFQSTLPNDYTAAVNRVTWSPDGTLLGVAYSKNIVQIYSYHGDGDIRNHLEIEAHNGSVNDLAFSFPNQTLSIVTCGDDRLIKVWNAVTGEKENQFEGHEAPVYCVCPHFRQNIQFIFSTATDGSIKVWLYDNMGSRLDYSAPGHSPSTMAYSDDGTRLFSCGTNKEGHSFIVEWNETEGSIKQTYNGLGKRANRPVQFDTTKNRYIVAGDEWLVKYWNMDNANLLMVMDADGGLPASPCVRFNKEGILLAVSTNNNGIKILANSDGVRLLKTVEKRSFDASRIASSSAAKITALTPPGPAVLTTMPPITMTVK
ncbi:topless-related protein 4-like [Bidens hawaiensis]|uniref:topless-related protein 4-like n=1 Tax=Bidens hawaiensis TaxID=980011 RepID=UPI004048F5F0